MGHGNDQTIWPCFATSSVRVAGSEIKEQPTLATVLEPRLSLKREYSEIFFLRTGRPHPFRETLTATLKVRDGLK